ncbi:MAG: N-acetylmuramoyl-L-alanine amidase [Nitrospirales bacterium]|nr:N-acetylmuramoyl-L-alanine amidase [Nitrospira sp.]MDR4502230.1 N-acetylmuramoyl-L-alanine amidase [Nitrospirales bacterium]
MARFEILPDLMFVDRQGWGAKNSFPRLGHRVPRTKRTHVIIHHTVVTDRSDTSPVVWETLREVYRNMRRLQTIRPDLGNDVPYNFVVYLMAKKKGMVICEGRGEDRSGAHTKGHNTEGIGVAFAGDFEDETVAGIEVSRRLFLLSGFLGWLKHDPSHPDYGMYPAMKNLGVMRPSDRAVYFHQDFKSTACPGKRAIPHLAQLAFINPKDF